MKHSFRLLFLLAMPFFMAACSGEKAEATLPKAEIVTFNFNGKDVRETATPMDVPLDKAVYVLTFNKTLDASKFDDSKILVSGINRSLLSFSVEDKTLTISANVELPSFTKVTIRLLEGSNMGVEIIYTYSLSFTTEYDPSDKFPRITTDALFEKVQKAAFSYSWDYAHPTSGLTRERLNSGNTVTTGGSGMCLMGIPVAIERGWITRSEGAARVQKIVDFLYNKADRFHGAWSHWLDGETGKALPFSTYDNGADLVESAFMIEGLLTLKHYFTGSDAVETSIRETIQKIWNEVEWTWFQQNGQKKLYWHWSSDYGWKMNMPVTGWNEGLIVYVLAASSPTYPIEKEVYDAGWSNYGANKLNYKNPLFFTHYSFLGLDPRNLKDQWFDYWTENKAMATTNYNYCVSKGSNGYSDKCWGLTASDYSKGYTASSPANDTGTIAPTAALSSYPYLPEQAQAAMEYFYYTLGDNLWGTYGFRDAFSLKDNWFAASYIAIDEGPIVAMMENWRTGLLWNCFMQDEDVQRGLTKLGFTWK